MSNKLFVKQEKVQLEDNEVGPILPGDEIAIPWTFTKERWQEGSYLWKRGDRVMVSFVAAVHKHMGYFRDLIAGIEKAGLRVAVPTPLYDMTGILKHYRFTMHREEDADFGESVEVWERSPVVTPKEESDARGHGQGDSRAP